MKRKTPSPPLSPAARRNMRGNILFMILMGIFLFGLLTLAISNYSKDQSNILPEQTRDDQINRMLAYTSTLEQALNEMVLTGASQAGSLYQNLDLSKPGDPNYETGNHALELYYPTGGGVAYQSASSNSGTPVASGYGIAPGASISGVGCTPGATNTISENSQTITTGECTAGTGHIVFTANIANASYCARINQIINNSTTVPTMSSATFTSLFTNDATVAVDATSCAACVSVKQLCVTDGSGNYGFYADLFPPHWIHLQ